MDKKNTPAKQPRKKASTEVLEVSNEPIEMTAEQYELAIQEKEKQEIAKFTIADAAIAQLNEQYSKITVNGIEDKDGYNVLKTALADVVNKRGLIEKKRKSIKDDYLRIGKAIDTEAKRLTDLILEVEQPLKDLKKKIDDEKEAEKKRKEEESEQKLKERVETLKEKGMVFDGSFYSIGQTITVDISTIKTLKDSEFLALTAKVDLEKKRLDEEAEKLRLEKEEAERQRQEEIRLMEEERRKMDEEKRKLEEERLAMQREKDELENQKRQQEKELQEQRERAAKERTEHRARTLEQMGFSFSISNSTYTYKNEGGVVEIKAGIVETAEADYWTKSLDDAKEDIRAVNENRDKILEQKRKDDEEAERQRKAIEEQERKDREEKERLEKEQEEAERLAKLPDVKKVAEYFAKLKAVPVPEVTNEEMFETLKAYADMMENVSKLIDEELNS